MTVKKIQKLLKFLLIIQLCFFQTTSYAQTLFKGGKEVLDVDVTLKKIPAINVVDKEGNKYELDKYIKINKQHADKPFLLVLWGTGEPNGIKSLNELAESKISDGYNIVAIFIDYKEVNAKAMNNQISNLNIGKKWDKFLVLSTSFTEATKRMFVTYYPMHIYANSFMDIITVANVQPNSSAKIMLDNIHAGLKKGDKVWYSKEEYFANSTDDTAAFFKQYVFTPGYARFTSGTKKNLLTKINYTIKGSDFLIDGDLITQTENGKITSIGKFTDGIPTDTFKTWFEDGKIRSVYPINGTYKIYDQKGIVTYDGPITNGLGDGVFTEYVDGKKAVISNYKNGVRLGIQQKVGYGGNVLEWYASSEYEFEGYLKEGLQKIKKNKLIGFADRTGKIIIPFQFTYAYDFKNEKAEVSIDEEQFDIDKKGVRLKKEEVVVAPAKKEVEQKKYDQLYYLIEGFRKVKLNNKYGYVNEAREEITAIEYDEAWDFHEGMAAVKKGEKMGYINNTGKLVIALKYLAGDVFINGTARVAINENGTNKYGYVNKTGKEVIPVIYGYPRRSGDKYIILKKENTSGMLDWSQKTVLPFIYEEINDFAEGRALIKKDGIYGFVDERNNVVGEMKYAEARSFKEGRAAVKIMEDSLSLWGFVDLQGKLAVPFGKLSRVENFVDGYARVVDNINYKWGMIDKNGKLIIPFKYSGISWNGYKEDIITAAIDKKWGAIDRSNNVVVPFIYDFVDDFAEGMARVKINKKFGFVNKDGELVIPVKYDAVLDFKDGIASVEIDGKWRKINKQGEMQD